MEELTVFTPEPASEWLFVWGGLLGSLLLIVIFVFVNTQESERSKVRVFVATYWTTTTMYFVFASVFATGLLLNALVIREWRSIIGVLCGVNMVACFVLYLKSSRERFDSLGDEDDRQR